ncbi:hypothetical protein BH09SUM1_BH09SUM1_18260 [soil metagenome]
MKREWGIGNREWGMIGAAHFSQFEDGKMIIDETAFDSERIIPHTPDPTPSIPTHFPIPHSQYSIPLQCA